jgi:acyl-CoA synthetase (AMP-forming)/AMP-acid ligase II
VTAQAILARPFGQLSELIRLHARENPAGAALIQEEARVTYEELDRRMGRIAAGLQRRGIAPGERIAICASNSIGYALAFLGALRAGIVPALIPTGLAADAVEAMVADSGAKLLLRERDLAAPPEEDTAPVEPALAPESAFNIIYSSGTTGTPKGIVQPLSMRWLHMQRGLAYGFDRATVALISTPLYSNTTLVTFFPTLALGGCAVLMGRFDAAKYLEAAERHRSRTPCWCRCNTSASSRTRTSRAAISGRSA